jgi:hypothetical protein
MKATHHPQALCVRVPLGFKVHLLRGGLITQCPNCDVSAERITTLLPYIANWLEAEGWFELMGGPSTDVDKF